jgi:hypothetical protein
MRIWSIIAAALGIFILPAVAADVPVPNAAYSAQRVMETGGGQIMSGQIYHDRGKERWEVSMGGMPRVTIMRPDLGKMIMYMPQMNMAMEFALDGDPQFGLPFGQPTNLTGPEPKAVGRADVAGESTTKYRTEVDNGTDAPFVVFSWVTDDGIIMRIEGSGPEGDFVMYLKELSRGPQDAALFEMPVGAQLMPTNPAMFNRPQ